MHVALSILIAAAGGGSSSYGGGGGGGGFSGGGGSGSGSGEPPPLWLVLLIVVGVIAFLAFGAVAERRRRRRRRARVARAHALSVEAAQDDPWFAADSVVSEAAKLFHAVQEAWDARDVQRLEALVGKDLLVEWRRRLDDFASKGWHSRCSVLDGPQVEYVGMVNREDDTDDRVVVRLEAKLRDVVETATGGIVKKDGATSEETSLAEYWTLGRREHGWIVVSIEQDAEGAHHLEAPLVPSPWSDDQKLSDETALERARADAAPEGTPMASLAEVDYAGDARKQALDLSLVDERFAPHVLEAAARRAVAAWAEAVDGDDAALRELAGEEAVRSLLYPTESTRVVVRGPQLEALRIVSLDPEAEPARLGVEARLRGRRYVEDRDTLALHSGSRDDETTFSERWTLVLDGEGGVLADDGSDGEVGGLADDGSGDRPLRGSPWRIGERAAVS